MKKTIDNNKILSTLNLLVIVLFLNINVNSQIIFQETFNEPNDATSGSANSVNWSSSCPTCLTGDYWKVNSGVFEGNDTNGEAEWITDDIIDVSNCDFIEISFDIQSQGTMEACGTGCNSVDWVLFQYNMGGTWIDPSNSYLCSGPCAGLNVVASDDVSTTYSTGCIPVNGNGLQLRIAVQCWASSEFWQIDNITVNCSSPDSGTNGNLTICSSSNPVNLLNQLGGTPDNGGTWTGPSNLTGGDLGTFDPSTMTSGNYTYTVGTTPCQDNSSVTVTIVNSNSAGNSNTVNLCSNSSSINLFNELGGTPDNGGTWSGPSNLTGGDLGTFNPATMNPGNYTYTVGTAPCDVSATITVNTPNNFSIGLENDSICIGEIGILTATPSVNGGTFSWTPNGNNTSTNSYSPTVSTTYTATYSLGNCSISESAEIIVSPLPAIDAGIDQTVCEGEEITLVANGAQVYSWDNNILDGVAFTPSLGTQSYMVTGTDINECSSTDIVDVTVLPTPIADANASLIVGQAPLEITIDNFSSGATVYDWYYGNGQNETTYTNETVSTIYTQEGIYTIELVASNGLCLNTWTQLITVNVSNPLIVDVPNIFTPNSDGVNDVYQLNIENAESINAVIINRWGNVITEYNELGFFWDGTINGIEANEGTYFIKYDIKGLDGTINAGQSYFQLVR